MIFRKDITLSSGELNKINEHLRNYVNHESSEEGITISISFLPALGRVISLNIKGYIVDIS